MTRMTPETWWGWAQLHSLVTEHAILPEWAPRPYLIATVDLGPAAEDRVGILPEGGQPILRRGLARELEAREGELASGFHDTAVCLALHDYACALRSYERGVVVDAREAASARCQALHRASAGVKPGDWRRLARADVMARAWRDTRFY